MGPTVTMLGGGVGCSRLAVPLAAGVDPGHLTLVVNTADDLWRYGLRICPDLDTNLYALAGMRDQDRGWGLAGDSFNTMGQLRRMGHDAWFNLGDLDLATHLLRTKLLAEGLSLSSLTARLAEGLGVCTRLLPMTDSEVSTLVTRSDGTYSFEEWFVKLKAAGPVEGVSYDGIEGATAAPGVLEAINDADLVVLGPSNPVSSVEPILSLPGVRDCLADRRSSVVAVTPIVDAVPIVDSGEAQRARARQELMRARELAHTPMAVAGLYHDLAATFVLDGADAENEPMIQAKKMGVIVTDTILADADRGRRLAEVLLSCVGVTP